MAWCCAVEYVKPEEQAWERSVEDKLLYLVSVIEQKVLMVGWAASRKMDRCASYRTTVVAIQGSRKSFAGVIRGCCR